MKSYLFILLTVFFVETVNAQMVSFPEHEIKTRALTIKVNDDRNKKGYVYGFNDTALFITRSRIKLFDPNYKGAYQVIPYEQIETAKFRKSGSVGKGLLFGMLAGIGSGVLIGQVAASKTSSSEWNLSPGIDRAVGGFLGFGFGGIIGAIIGSNSKKFNVNKSRIEFEQLTRHIEMLGTK